MEKFGWISTINSGKCVIFKIDKLLSFTLPYYTMTPEERFDAILQDFVSQTDVTVGKMMSSTALQYKGKVFAFFYQDSMCFKLGKSFQPKDSGITQWKYLSPFKNKPPMQAWYVIDAVHSNLWPDLTREALDLMQ